MSADIFNFPKKNMHAARCSGFSKALVAVTILLDFSAADAMQIIASWTSLGLLAEEEAEALRAFYGW